MFVSELLVVYDRAMSDAIAHQSEPERPDPRPRLSPDHSSRQLRGWRCSECGVARAVHAPWCPDCGGQLLVVDFGPLGTVWSSTVVHLNIADIPAPYGLAYIDLDDGPRFLAHIDGAEEPLLVAGRVTISGINERGDIEVTSITTGHETS